MSASGNSGGERSARVRTKRITARSLAADDESTQGWPESWVVVYTNVLRLVCERFELSAAREGYLVGRHSRCDIVVDSGAVSRQHARVERRAGAWVVRDLSSTNGVYVNDVRVAEHTLAHGDRVQIGDTFFKHLAGDHAEAAYVEALRTALVTDGLTQTANERAFHVALAAAVRRATHEGDALALVIADVDWFKAINDAHGHPAGDRVLRELAGVLRGALPPGATLGRVGGEEFAVLLPGRTLDDALAVAEAARAAIAAHPFASPVGALEVTASFGAAALGPGTDTPTRLFQRADERLYAAKHEGRNRIRGA
jgi:diguanylate cyclase (GGDEF)-like protein